MLCNSTLVKTSQYADGLEKWQVLHEDGAVRAETCRRYLVNNTYIQLYIRILLEN